jgi:hypothetical protein
VLFSIWIAVENRGRRSGHGAALTLLMEQSLSQDEFIEDVERPEPRRFHCPKCGSSDVRRARSEGMLSAVMQMFGQWPFRCRSCRSRFFRRASGPEDE